MGVVAVGLNVRRNWLLDSQLALYLPLWDSRLKTSPITSQDIYSHSCDVTGALWTPQGRAFTGEDDYIDAGNRASLNFTTGDFSIDAWIYPTNIVVNPTIAGKGTSNVDGWLFWIHSTGLLMLRTNQSGANQTSQSSAVISVNNWYHVAATRDGASVRLYCNGVDVTSTAATHIDPAATSTAFKVGVSGNNANDFTGTIGEVLIFNRALSAAEIQNHRLATMWRYQ